MRPLQALFYGLCRYWDIEIRQLQDVAEFELPGLGLYVIVLDDGRDRAVDEDKIRTSGERVVALDRDKVETLRRIDSREFFIHRLYYCQRLQAAANLVRRYGTVQ